MFSRLLAASRVLSDLRPLQGEILAAGEQRVLLTLDEATVLAGQPGVLRFADLIESLAQVTYDVELVEQDRGLRRVGFGGVAKRLPHVHQGELDAAALRLAEEGVELAHAGLGAILPAEPDRPLPIEVADHDAVDVTFADRDLVDADALRSGGSRASQLRSHVLLLQFLDRMPVERELLGHVLDRRAAAAPADVIGESLRVKRVVGEPVQPLALHSAARPAIDAPDGKLEVHPRVARRQIANPARMPVVPAVVRASTHSAPCFFERRTSVTMRAFGSPKMPRTLARGRNPGKAYASTRRRARLRDLAIAQACQVFGTRQCVENPARMPLPGSS